MLDGKMLDGVKLVSDENYFATNSEVEFMLETAFQQASQGWGVRQDQGVMLRLAKELKLSQGLQAKAQAGHDQLKGLQLENGRLKKKIRILEGQEAALVGANRTVGEQAAEIERLTEAYADAARKVAELKADAAALDAAE